jgi:hypothetical protein
VAAYCADNLARWRWPAAVRRLVMFADADPDGINAAGVLPTGAVSADANRRAAAGLATQAAQNRAEGEHEDPSSNEASTSASSTLRAKLALIGYRLRRVRWGGYLTTLRNLSPDEASLDGGARFLQRVAR